MVERAAAVDPLSPYAAAMVGLVTLHGGDPQGAIAEFERALSYEKGYIFALSWLGIAQATVGLYDQAIESLQPCVQASGGTSYYLSMLGWANAVAGHRLEARAILAECEDLARKENAVTFGTVWLTAALGDVGRAWELFDRAHRERQDMMLFLDFPALDPLRSDPRFDPVLSSVRW
jgi:tetratricopeptide (TPR) repeat protein